MTPLRHLESMYFRKERRICISEGRGRVCRLFVPNIADALEEKQGQNVALPVGAIDGRSAKSIRSIPKGRFQVFVRHRGPTLVALKFIFRMRKGKSVTAARMSTRVSLLEDKTPCGIEQ